MTKPIINYATRDVLSILSQINNDVELKQTPDVWKKMFAGIFDNLSNQLNAIVNALVLRTAYARPILQDVLRLNDYDLEWKSQSIVDITMTIDPALTVSSSYTVSAADVIAKTLGTLTRPALRFEGKTDVVFAMGTSSTTTTVYQQEIRPAVVIGQTSGASWQEIDLPDVDVIKQSLTLLIGVDNYTLVDSFANITGSDKVFKIYYRSDGSSYIQLPGIDEVTGFSYGYLPTAGQNVTANYAVGGGSDGNVEAGAISQYAGTDSGVLTVTNPLKAEGGAAEESIANAIAIAPLRARETGYFLNESTGISLIRANLDGVLLASIVKTALLTVSVWIIPNGGGLPSSGLKTAVQDLLTERSPLEDITVTVNDPSYVSTSIAIQLKLYTGFEFSVISKYCKLAIVLKAHELSESIVNIYRENGISDAIDEINANFGSITGTFTVENDGVQVQDILDHTTPVKFGESLVLEDIPGACGLIAGVDFVKVTSPTSDITGMDGAFVRVTSVSVVQI